jgi:hypothetical protein
MKKPSDLRWLVWYAFSIMVDVCGFILAIYTLINAEKIWKYILAIAALTCFTCSISRIISMLPKAKTHYIDYKASRK